MKKHLKIISFIFLFFISIQNIFALDANLELDKRSVDINDYINLKITISSQQGGDIGITEIKGLENFEIINQSQSQSSSTSMIINNGKTESKIETSHFLNLTLKAKNKGDFDIGPAVLERGNDKIETNKVSLSVLGENLFINNNINVPTTTSPPNNNQEKEDLLNNSNNLNKISENPIIDYEKTDKKVFEENNELYLLFGILLLIGLSLYFYIKNNPDLLDNLIKDKTKKYNNSGKIEKNKTFNEEECIDFECKDIKYSYPDLSSDNFICEINKVFNSKISNKYNINNVDNLTGNQILDLIKYSDKEKIMFIIENLNKAKYSNIISNKSKILELIKDL